MNSFILPLEACLGNNAAVSGKKAATLADLLARGVNVPAGLCVTTEAYRYFLNHTKIKNSIIIELSRKDIKDMRWEEMWDCSQRIRSFFLTAKIPKRMEDILKTAIRKKFRGRPVAVRSSSSLEDAKECSFAGIHESYLNLKQPENILEHIRKVWASLWSDTVLAYSKELKFDINASFMAVLIQEMVIGEKSGVAFSVNPQKESEAVIEAVFGLNQGLVDGAVEPDRWTISRKRGTLLSEKVANHTHHMIAKAEGIVLAQRTAPNSQKAVLSQTQVSEVFHVSQKLEKYFQSPQDMEWTFKNNDLYVLQCRPITTVKKTDEFDRRAYDVSLKRSFESLKKLREKIEGRLLPKMLDDIQQAKQIKLAGLSDRELGLEIRRRARVYQLWDKIYWSDFIPFAHGIRLFGQVYNETLKAKNPEEYIDILAHTRTLSVARNEKLEEMADMIRKNPAVVGQRLTIQDPNLKIQLNEFLGNFAMTSYQSGMSATYQKSIIRLIIELAKKQARPKRKSNKKALRLEKKFIESFQETDRSQARALIDLAKSSYRLRDDDNIYMGNLKAQWENALKLGKSRLSKTTHGGIQFENDEDVIRSLLNKNYKPRVLSSRSADKTSSRVFMRQMRGQPASRGITKGKARIIQKDDDILNVKQGEIIVCDRMDPRMTFVMPIVSAIIEARGGMLVHGAIIAREYGLPCVTGVLHASENIQTGDEVMVDGYIGLVINCTKRA